MKNKKIWSIIVAVGVFSAVLLLDLLTKRLIITKYIPNQGDAIDVIPGFINFQYVENYGGGWGILSGKPVLLIVLSLIVMGLFLLFYILRVRMVGKNSSMWLSVSMGLVAGGCLGNMIDRLAFGFVRDFINFQFMSFPTFNFADVAICVGMVCVSIYFIFFYSKEEKGLKKEGK